MQTGEMEKQNLQRKSQAMSKYRLLCVFVCEVASVS